MGACKLLAMTRETTAGHPADVCVPAVATTVNITEEVDQALLTEAQRVLGSTSAEESINQALAELIQERRRRIAVEAQLVRFEAGQFAAGRFAAPQPGSPA